MAKVKIRQICKLQDSINGEFKQQVGRKNNLVPRVLSYSLSRTEGRVGENPEKEVAERRGRQNAGVWQSQRGYHLRVLSWSPLDIIVFDH